MPKEEITFRIRISPAFTELCEIHLRMAELIEREAILMDQIRIASMTGT